MNYQDNIPENIRKLLEDNNMNPDNVSYYAWPQTFGSTAGPMNCMGGASMSTFTVKVYTDYNGSTIYYCSGMYAFSETFEQNKYIKEWTEVPKEFMEE